LEHAHPKNIVVTGRSIHRWIVFTLTNLTRQLGMLVASPGSLDAHPVAAACGVPARRHLTGAAPVGRMRSRVEIGIKAAGKVAPRSFTRPGEGRSVTLTNGDPPGYDTAAGASACNQKNYRAANVRSDTTEEPPRQTRR
jgi:hypothetical protein